MRHVGSHHGERGGINIVHRKEKENERKGRENVFVDGKQCGLFVLSLARVREGNFDCLVY